MLHKLPKARPIFFSFFILLCIYASGCVQTQLPQNTAPVRSKLLKLSEQMLPQHQKRLSSLLAASAWQRSEPKRQELLNELKDDSQLCLYLNARIELSHALVHRFRIDHSLCLDPKFEQQELEENTRVGLEFCEQFSKDYSQDSEIDRLKAEFQLLNIWGFTSAVGGGVKAISPLYAALRKDPNNYLIQLAWGKRYLYAPSGFGRNPNKALSFNQIATRLRPLAPQPLIYMSLCYWEIGDKENAKHYLQVLSEMHPKHEWIQLISSKYRKEQQEDAKQK